MDRYWLLTWTTYGTWLPGDTRGFVGRVWDARSEEEVPDDGIKRLEHDEPGTEYDFWMPGLQAASRDLLRGSPVWLNREQALALIGQLRETAEHRRWELVAAAVMANHVHVLVGVTGDPDPATLLRDFKSSGSRALNKRWGKPKSGTWWTESGLRRKKVGDAIFASLRYVRKQDWALAVWCHGDAPDA